MSWSRDRCLKLRKKEKEYNYISPIPFTVYYKGLNPVVVKEKRALFNWRVEGRNVILSEMSIVIELLSHRDKPDILQKSFLGFKIQMPSECQTYNSSKERKILLEY